MNGQPSNQSSSTECLPQFMASVVCPVQPCELGDGRFEVNVASGDGKAYGFVNLADFGCVSVTAGWSQSLADHIQQHFNDGSYAKALRRRADDLTRRANTLDAAHTYAQKENQQ